MQHSSQCFVLLFAGSCAKIYAIEARACHKQYTCCKQYRWRHTEASHKKQYAWAKAPGHEVAYRLYIWWWKQSRTGRGQKLPSWFVGGLYAGEVCNRITELPADAYAALLLFVAWYDHLVSLYLFCANSLQLLTTIYSSKLVSYLPRTCCRSGRGRAELY